MNNRKKKSKNYLDKNLQALEKLNRKELVQSIQQAKQPSWMDIVLSKDKAPNILLNLGSKVEPVWSMESPKKEALAIVKNLPPANRQNAMVLIGCGWYLLPEMLKRKLDKNHKIIVAEPEPFMIKKCSEKYDWSKYIQSGNLIFCKDKEEIPDIIAIIDSAVVVERWNLIVENYAKNLPQIYSDVILSANNIINQCMCNTGTVMGAGMEMAKNDIRTLPYIITHRGIKDLFNKFPNKPAILVSTGPSLGKNIHKLQDIQDKVIIIAVAQALRPLLAYDVVPDFICTVDFGKTNLGHFRGLMDSKVPLICLNRTYAPLVQQWKGPKFIVGTPVPGYQENICSLMEKKGHVIQGGSVAHLCLGLAISMGCNPIVMIGQDLSVGEGVSHFSQADESGKVVVLNDGNIVWKVKDQKSHLQKSNEGTFSMGRTVLVPGYYGGSVVTNTGLASFITSFERIIQQTPNKTIINSTEGGAQIKGSEQKSLDQVITDYVKEPIDKEIIIKPLLTPDPETDSLINQALELLRKDSEVLKVISEESSKALETNKDMMEVLDSKKRFSEKREELKKLLEENFQPSSKAEEYSKKNPLVTLAIYGASRRIQGEEFQTKQNPSAKYLLNNLGELKTRVQRNSLILEAAKKESEALLKIYKEDIQLLTKYQTTKDPNIFTKKEFYPISLRSIQKDLKNGFWARALLNARKKMEEIKKKETPPSLQEWEKIVDIALNMREEEIKKAQEWDSSQGMDLLKYNQLVEESREVAKNSKDFEKCVTILRKALGLFPDKQEALWGIATSLFFLTKYEEAEEYYSKLTQLYPDINRFQYERGLNLLAIPERVKEGGKIVRDLLEEDPTYRPFLKRLGELFIKNGSITEGESCYIEYLKYFPHDYIVWIKLAEVYKGKSSPPEWEKYKECIIKAKKIKPTNLLIKGEGE